MIDYYPLRKGLVDIRHGRPSKAGLVRTEVIDKNGEIYRGVKLDSSTLESKRVARYRLREFFDFRTPVYRKHDAGEQEKMSRLQDYTGNIVFSSSGYPIYRKCLDRMVEKTRDIEVAPEECYIEIRRAA